LNPFYFQGKEDGAVLVGEFQRFVSSLLSNADELYLIQIFKQKFEGPNSVNYTTRRPNKRLKDLENYAPDCHDIPAS